MFNRYVVLADICSSLKAQALNFTLQLHGNAKLGELQAKSRSDSQDARTCTAKSRRDASGSTRAAFHCPTNSFYNNRRTSVWLRDSTMAEDLGAGWEYRGQVVQIGREYRRRIFVLWSNKSIMSLTNLSMNELHGQQSGSERHSSASRASHSFASLSSSFSRYHSSNLEAPSIDELGGLGEITTVDFRFRPSTGRITASNQPMAATQGQQPDLAPGIPTVTHSKTHIQLIIASRVSLQLHVVIDPWPDSILRQVFAGQQCQIQRPREDDIRCFLIEPPALWNPYLRVSAYLLHY
ncbi:hypothetical protein BDP27DRAFT_1422499 [Rhodocollybia butyracea]|uniref:Uncharacterized protein n=1 Tax=Rhodocollybia butyracea TaxID=206335 RepID=A0A9P5PTW3_9AGAR|nr:hypothetical protein BDP27DRAFT_1422499 [Rhodocollybia butyracea]